ncbi:protein of unknown function [Methylocaldum szegediense]|uniref:Uncharacterized protein n=1 Tax=Methylocaldum szegediense TaxID=73780 RepID=A0ABM9HY01_9GAMM|nr:protein of unknown function [Methylocaldum szegediense]
MVSEANRIVRGHERCGLFFTEQCGLSSWEVVSETNRPFAELRTGIIREPPFEVAQDRCHSRTAFG